jgi:glycosyltransferase involved in cell wall biosynthesis
MKPTMLVFAPVATRSGYGDFSRDLVRHFIEYDKFDVKILSVPWGETPMNALNVDNPSDKIIIDRIVKEQITQRPEVYVHVGIPSEARQIGKYNILCTAGIETTVVSANWVEACNNMDLILTISEHSKSAFLNSRYRYSGGVLEVTKPIEVLHNCVNTAIFGKHSPTNKEFSKQLNNISENFCFLFVGHWLRGDYGEDRKNVPLLIKLFLETFKQVKTKEVPALILKTSSAGFSILDRESILDRIEQIKKTVILGPGQTLPNVYLLHGELTDEEMNTLYTHPKVKVHISLTKGEGFGRPLLEASVSGKPVMASGWSGHLDFLDKERALLVGGELNPVHESSIWENVIIKEAHWFTPDVSQAMNGMAAIALNYNIYKKKAYELALENRKRFSYDAIRDKTFQLLDKYLPEFPVEVPITLPKLKKIKAPGVK